MDSLALTNEELDWLTVNCPFFGSEYINYLRKFKFKCKEHLETVFHAETGALEIIVSGLWTDTILYEVPLMSLVSETYFECVDCDWDSDGQYELAFEKCKRLLEAGCTFSEFGTRRRRSHLTQDIVLKALVDSANQNQNSSGKLVGTSNVFFAMKYKIKPVGTVAHEWTMAVSGNCVWHVHNI